MSRMVIPSNECPSRVLLEGFHHLLREAHGAKTIISCEEAISGLGSRSVILDAGDNGLG